MHLVEAINVLMVVFKAPNSDVHLITNADKVVGSVYLMDACNGLTMEAESGVDQVYLINRKENDCALR